MSALNALVIGSGGREHALVRQLAASARIGRLFALPGNPGTAQHATNLAGDPLDTGTLLRLTGEHAIELVVIGPEAPLAAGMADALRRNGHLVIGPGQAAARLESSKAFAKDFMTQHGIPTAAFRSFAAAGMEAAKAYARELRFPVVVKADGLAAGKGVVIAHTAGEADAALEAILREKRFGAAGDQVVVEEFLAGVELSVTLLANGTDYVLLPTAKDYKRAVEGGRGPNTGGMGSLSPVPFATGELGQKIESRIIRPSLRGLAEAGLPFVGVLFVGLMIVDREPHVLEYNVRLGDPEAQSILPRIQSDVGELLIRCAEGRLAGTDVRVAPEAAVTVVCASQGYPGEYRKGLPIEGLAEAEALGALVTQAGTTERDGQLRTAGGRVLSVTACRKTLAAAQRTALEAAEAIRFDGRYYRHDIGSDILSPAHDS